ncbi:MAG TPA: hypothetical protein VFU22_13450 [Roseiflexaceae bacterium]|nr:hypothetical protein [Roseiflexaceae bacterium]
MESIPEELKQFIFASFESVDQLRMLLLLQASPERGWSPLSVSAKLYLQPGVVQVGLDTLQRKGFLAVHDQSDPRYRYQPASTELEQMVRAVVKLDQTRPVTLIKLIYARPKDALQSFADAFKLRRDS